MTLKKFLLSLFILSGTLAACGPAYAQSNANRLYRNCSGTTTKAVVSLDVAGNITLVPCTGKSTTVSGIFTPSGTFNLTSLSATTPTSGINLFTTAGGSLGWIGTSGFSTTLSVTGQTASRTYTLPDAANGTFLVSTLVNLDRTVTAGGTTGAQAINKTAGTVNFAAAATSLVVTNSLVTTTSLIWPVIRTADATCTFVKSVVAGSGSFTITMNAACTAETSVGFWVTN